MDRASVIEETCFTRGVDKALVTELCDNHGCGQTFRARFYRALVRESEERRVAISLIALQQQHSSKVQFGQSRADVLLRHSEGKQLQSAHLISNTKGGFSVSRVLIAFL
jgi:hypothetical protein